MILFLFTIMLMNLNKENEVHKPRITRLGAVVSFCLITVVLIFLHQLKTYHWRIHKYWEDYQSIKVLGKVLLNEYMVPFEFASVLLLVAMIGTVLLSKKEKRNNMNNILNEIGNYIFLSTILFLYWGLWRIIQAKCNYRIYVCRNMLNAVNLLFVAFTYHQDAQGQIFVFSHGCSCCRSCRRISHSSFDI
jgi:hypothetical protein